MTVCQLSVVVPCFNEEEVLLAFHRALRSVLEAAREPFEVCYVDDGSSDSTRELMRGLAAADPRVRYTSFSRNFGKEAAMLAGLRMARGDAVALMDADLQHPPELLPQMLRLRRDGYHQVVARRDRTGEGPARRALSSLYYRLLGHCTDVGMVDGEGDFRLLSRAAADAVLALPETNRFSKGLFSWIGFETAAVAYRNVDRAAGCSKWGGRRLLDYGIDGIVSFNTRPLRLALHAGLALALAAGGYALWIVCDVALHGVQVPGFATLLTAVLALGGLQLATLGVIGEYVGRIYREAKRRPLYVVRETDADRRAAAPPDPPREQPPADPEPRPAPPPAAPARTLRQLLTFAAVGVVNTCVYLAVYATLNRWIPYLAAHAVGFAVSVTGSFLLNSYATCRERPTWRGFARFPLSSLANLVCSGALLFAGVHSLGLGKNVAAVLAGVAAMPLSFVLARWAITSGAARTARPRPAPSPAAPPAAAQETAEVSRSW